MTTETEVTPAQKLADAESRASSAKAAFDAMVAAGAGFEPSLTDDERYAKQVATFRELEEANKALASAKRDAESAERQAKLGPVNEALNGLHDRIRKLVVDSKAEDAIKNAEAGNVITFTVTFSEAENSPTVNHRVAGLQAPKASNGESTGTRARIKIVADGKEYTPTEYIEAYFEQGTAAGLNWGDKAERLAYKQDHSKRARDLAAKLGHEVQ